MSVILVLVCGRTFMRINETCQEMITSMYSHVIHLNLSIIILFRLDYQRESSGNRAYLLLKTSVSVFFSLASEISKGIL